MSSIQFIEFSLVFYISLCLERGYYKQGGPPKVFKQLDSKQFYEQKTLDVKVCISTLPDFTVNLVKNVSVTDFRGIWRQGF